MPVKPVTVPYCAIPMSEQSTMNGKRPPRHFEPKEFQSEHINDWCAGCGDHGILRALEQALSDSGLSPDEVAVFGGIGCSGKTPYYMNTYGIHRCPPWRAKRRRVVPGSREATRDTRRAEGAKGDPKGASERGVQSYGRPVCSRNELAMLWRNAG